MNPVAALKLIDSQSRLLNHTVTHALSLASAEDLLRKVPDGWLTRHIPCAWGLRQDGYFWDRSDWHVDGMNDCRMFLEEGSQIAKVLAGLHGDVPGEWAELLPGPMMQALGTESGVYLADYWVLTLYHLAWSGHLPYRCATDYHTGDDIEHPPFCLTSRLPVDLAQASADALTLLIEAAPDHGRRSPVSVLGPRRASEAAISPERQKVQDLTADTDNEPSADAGEGISVTEAATLLMDVVSGIDLSKAKARVSKAAGKGEFKTNGLTRNCRRIELDSFNTWRFKQRERDLDAADANDA